MTEQPKTISQIMREALDEIVAETEVTAIEDIEKLDNIECIASSAIDDVDDMSHYLAGIDYSFMQSHIDGIPAEEARFVALSQYERRIELASELDKARREKSEFLDKIIERIKIKREALPIEYAKLVQDSLSDKKDAEISEEILNIVIGSSDITLEWVLNYLESEMK
ncbi:hypothetical protein OfM1_19030 [Lactovum odontotermitis]